jgi:hypothetical protein
VGVIVVSSSRFSPHAGLTYRVRHHLLWVTPYPGRAKRSNVM